MHRIALPHRRSVPLRGLPRPLLAVLLVFSAAGFIATSASAEARPSHHGRRLLAMGTVSRAHGGYIRARDGAALYVPPGALNERRARATISELRPSKFAFAIRGEWRGVVRVTLPAPPKGWAPIVLHTVKGMNKVESRKLGQMTVWVHHLSTFEVVPQACLDVLYATAEEGPEVAGPSLGTCLTAYGVVELGALGIQALTSLASQSGQPVSPGGTSTGSSGPPIPVSSTPVNKGGLQGPTVNPQEPGPSTNPQPNPSPTSEEPPAPPPPPGRSIEIGWSGAHPGWIWMTFNGFSTGSHAYSCVFNNETDTYTLGETQSPETWDNAATCMDEESGGTVRVESEGVSSNTITVP